MTSIKQPNGKMAIKHLLAQRDQCCQRSCADINGRVCVCVSARTVCVPVHIKSGPTFLFMTNSLYKRCSLSRCNEPLTLRLSVTATSLLTRRGVHNTMY